MDVPMHILPGFKPSFSRLLGRLCSIQGATSSDYVAHSTGSYYVAITDSNGCSAVSNAIIITGIEDLRQQFFHIYPNPASDYVIVSYNPSFISGKASFEVDDLLGQVYSQPVPGYSGNQPIDVSQFANGIYTAYIKSNEQIIA